MRTHVLLVAVAGALSIGCECGTTHTIDPDAGAAADDARATSDAAGPSDAARLDVGPVDAAITRATGLRACGGVGGRFVAASAISPDGALIALANFETVTLLDAATGRELRTLGTPSGRSGNASSLAFSPDGSRLFVGHSDGLRELSVSDGRVVRDVRVARGCCGVAHLAIAPAAGVAVGYSEGFRVVSLTDGSIRDLPLTGLLTDGFDVSPDGRLAAFVSDTGVVLVELATGALVRELRVRAVSEVSFSPDGTQLALSRAERGVPTSEIVVVVRVADGTSRAFVDRSPSLLAFPLAWSDDGARLVIARDDAELVVLSVPPGDAPLAELSRVSTDVREAWTLDVGPADSVLLSRDHVALHTTTGGDLGGVAWLRAAQMDGAPRHGFGLDAAGHLLSEGVLWDPDTQLAVRRLAPLDGRAAVDATGRTLAWIEDGELVLDEDGAARRTPLSLEASSITIEDDALLLASRTELVVLDRASLAERSRASLSLRNDPVLLVRSPARTHVVVGALEDPPTVVELASGRDVTPEEVSSRIVRGPSALAFVDDTHFVGALYFGGVARLYSLDGSVRDLPEIPLARAVTATPLGEIVAARIDALSIHAPGTFLEAASLDVMAGAVQHHAMDVSPEGARVAWTSRERVEITCIDRE
jgi:sugar lactone lactonase YvrE